jgi:hypothetical protein
MTHHAKLVGPALLLAALLSGGSAAAADPEIQGDLQKEIREVRAELANLRELVTLRGETVALRLRILEDRIERLEKAALPASPSVVPRRALEFSPTPLDTGLSTIRLDNQMGVTAVVNLNGRTYSVPPFTVRALRNRTPGAVTYFTTAEGRGVQSPQRTTLGANETLTVTIRE